MDNTVSTHDETLLLAWYKTGKPPVAADDDITANRHGGNEQSIEANRLNRLGRECDRREIYRLICKRPRTIKECASEMGREFNTVSGRGTELLKLGLVRRTGEIRDGAAVLMGTGEPYPG
jgi:hypothetical protein